MGIQIVTEECTVKWPKLDKPHQNPNYPANDPTYSVQLVLAPGMHKATIDAIEAAVTSLAKGKVKAPDSWEPTPDGTYEPRINARMSWNRQVVDEALNPVDPLLCSQIIYGGAICKVAFDIYANKQNRVCFGLIAVQKVRDGDRLGGDQPRAEDLFKPIAISGSKVDPLG